MAAPCSVHGRRIISPSCTTKRGALVILERPDTDPGFCCVVCALAGLLGCLPRLANRACLLNRRPDPPLIWISIGHGGRRPPTPNPRTRCGWRLGARGARNPRRRPRFPGSINTHIKSKYTLAIKSVWHSSNIQKIVFFSDLLGEKHTRQRSRNTTQHIRTLHFGYQHIETLHFGYQVCLT
jgi:hypothetical protein